MLNNWVIERKTMLNNWVYSARGINNIVFNKLIKIKNEQKKKIMDSRLVEFIYFNPRVKMFSLSYFCSSH